MKAICFVKNGELPDSLGAAQTEALSRLQFQLDQELISGQIDIEGCLQSLLEEGSVSGSDQWLVYEVLHRIRDLQTTHEVAQEIATHEKTEQIIKLIAEGIKHLRT